MRVFPGEIHLRSPLGIWTGPLAAVVLVALMLACGAGCRRSSDTAAGPDSSAGVPEQISVLVTKGKSLYETGKPAEAVDYFRQASALAPTDGSLILNTANAELAAGLLDEARASVEAVLALNNSSAAAHYLSGLLFMRAQNFEEALKAFQTSEAIEPNSSDFARLNNLTFQIARAHMGLEQWDAAIERLYDLSTFDEDHPAVWYNLGQCLIRAGRQDEAADAMDRHQQQAAIRGTAQTPQRDLEISRHTDIFLPFILETPDPEGIPVTFTDVTGQRLGEAAGSWSGPMAVIDFNHTGTNSLWVIEDGLRFRLLKNNGATLEPSGEPHPLREGDRIHQILTGDIQNSGFEDIIALADSGTYAFNMKTNGLFIEQASFANLAELRAERGWLADINYTGHVDLIAQNSPGVSGSSTNLLTLENIGNFYFFDVTSTSSVPAQLPGLTDLVFEDWNSDDMLDMVIARDGQVVELRERIRGAGFSDPSSAEGWPVAERVWTADLDNDLRPDLIAGTSSGLSLHFRTDAPRQELPMDLESLEGIIATDFDNDGWKDIVAWGNRIRIWRNRGPAGFEEVTGKLGLSEWEHGRIRRIHPADMDNDGDTDLVADTFENGIRILDNAGGSVNRQLKLRLDGTRSNRSGLGIQIELTSGNWRTLHSVKYLPIEIGVGKRDRLDSLSIRWSDASDGDLDVAVAPKSVLVVTELRVATGSCPYLYAWDGSGYRFVTDLLGAAPLGLPSARGQLIPGDPHELVELGKAESFPARDGYYELQVTEELREVLYLDHAGLVVIDHPAGTEVYPTSKLVAGPPPAHEIIGVHKEHRLTEARRSDGADVTTAARAKDGVMVSPVRVREPQYRGLAEPWAVELEFEDMDAMESPVLVLNGWLQFGGGMANIAGSLRPDFPPPFPVLEAWSGEAGWTRLDVHAGAPAGKTKTIVVDLNGVLPGGCSRLRLSTAFEIHWDRISLMEKLPSQQLTRRDLQPQSADLHWRGFSKMSRSDESHPMTPDYDEVSSVPPWTHTPEGWCTAYGDVIELISGTDNKLALLNGGDELTLRFDASRLPSLPEELDRSFFFYNVGWDKDADFHVVEGSRVGPLPWHGMDYQNYGQEEPPPSVDQDWITRWNTRWVPGFTLQRKTNADNSAKTKGRVKIVEPGSGNLF